MTIYISAGKVFEFFCRAQYRVPKVASKGPVRRSRAVYAKLESNSEPERARVCQRVVVRAIASQSGSHREP